MKKTFCDMCGGSMENLEVPAYLTGAYVPVIVKGVEGETRQLEVAVHVKAIGIDVCGDCRAYLLDKLDVRPRAQKVESMDDAEGLNRRTRDGKVD